MQNINQLNPAIDNIFIIVFLMPLVILLIIVKLKLELKKQKLVFASAGNIKNKIQKNKKDIFINDTLIITNNNIKYKLGSKFRPIRISGSSMRDRKIFDNNIAVFDCKVDKSLYDTGDIVLIKMSSNHSKNPNKYKLRIFDKIINNEVITKKYEYQSDNKNNENYLNVKQIISSKKHNKKYLIGKFQFLLNDKQAQYIYDEYIVA